MNAIDQLYQTYQLFNSISLKDSFITSDSCLIPLCKHPFHIIHGRGLQSCNECNIMNVSMFPTRVFLPENFQQRSFIFS